MIFFKTLALTASYLGYFFSISTRINGGVYKAPFIYCCGISLVIYIFGLFGLLSTGVLLMTGIGIMLLLISIKQNSKQILRLVADNLWSLLIVIPYVLLYLAIDQDFQFLVWDEFSYWASSTKIIVATDAFFTENSPIFFKTYPPIQQLFQYYFIKLSFWSEKNVLYAQIFWTLSAILCALGSLVKKATWVPFLFFVACTSLYFFNYSYATLYSDALLGLCFGASVALAYDNKGAWSDHLVFFLCTANLLLLKEIAVVLVLIATTIFVLQSLWSNASQIKSDGTSTTRFALRAAFGVATLIAVQQSWSWYVKQIHATRDLVVPPLHSFTTQPLYDRLTATIRELVHRLFDTGYLALNHARGGYRPAIWLVLVVLLGLGCLVIALSQKSERAKAGMTLSVLSVGIFGYLAALFISYVIIFSEYEGVRLASFERYFSTYMIAWSLILFAFASNLICKLKMSQCVASMIVVGVTAAYFVPSRFYSDLRAIRSSGSDYQTRQSTEALANEVKRHIQLDQKVYFVAQDSNGFERVMFYYAMLPYTSSMSWCWSFGKKYTEGDVWTCDTSMLDLLNGYDYLALYRVDKQFWDLYSNLFEADVLGKTSGVFEIKRSDGKIIKIEQVEH